MGRRQFSVPAFICFFLGVGISVAVLGILHVDSVLPPKISSALAVDPVPGADLGFALSTWAQAPSNFQAHALGRFLLILSAIGVSAVSVTVLNLTVLLKNRSMARAQGRAVRVAVGASRKHLILEWARGPGALFGIAGCSGLLAGWIGRVALLASWPHALGRASPDGLGSLGTLVIGILFLAVLAASYARPPDLSGGATPGGILNGGERLVGTRYPEGLRRYIPALQIGFSLTLISGSAILLEGNPGAPTGSEAPYQPSGTLRTPVALHSTGATSARNPGPWENVISRVSRLPGVSRVALFTPGAWEGVGTTDLAWTECGACSIGGMSVPFQAPSVQHHVVSPDSFRILGVSVIQGREFTPLDSLRGPLVAVVNATYAREYFDRDGPIGKTIGLGAGQENWHTVVGVVQDFGVPGMGSAQAPKATVYLSSRQHPPDRAELLVVPGPDQVVDSNSVAEAIHETDGLILSEEPSGFQDHLRNAVASVAWFGRLSLLLGLGAFLIAVYGLSAVMEYSVSLRIREIGLRRAVGAGPWRIMGLVLWRSARIILVGVFLGLEGALFLAPLLEGIASEGRAFDVSLFLVAAASFLLFGLLGSMKPARRASSVPPRVAMGGI